MCELMINKMSDQLNDQLASVKQEVILKNLKKQ